MKLFSEIKRIFHCPGLAVAERQNTASASFSTVYQALPDMAEIQSVCALAPARDTLSLTLISDSGDMVRFTNHQTDAPDVTALTAGLAPDDNVDVSIEILKCAADGRFSIYDFPSFAEDLQRRPLLDILSWFSSLIRTQRGLMFEVFDYDISFSTRTMAFESAEHAVFKPKIDRIQRLNACKDSAYFYNMNTFEVIPDDFIMEGLIKAGECFQPLFGKLATILALAYAATTASLSDKMLSLQINGQRTWGCELPVDDIQENETWQNIYAWIFTDGNPTDKALIARNVISLHCKFEAPLRLDSTVFEAIKTNYNLYLRSNVNQYLDMKRDIAKFIQDIVAQVGEYAVAILGKFKTNLFAIFGFLFTVVLTQIGGAQDWGVIFTKHTLYLIELFVLGSLVYLLICYFETRFKLEKTRQGYFELKENYEDVLSEAEIKEAFKNDELLNKTMKSAQRGMVGWSVAWGVLLAAAVLVIEVFTTNHGLIVWLWEHIGAARGG